jgi:hypothetical protein
VAGELRPRARDIAVANQHFVAGFYVGGASSERSSDILRRFICCIIVTLLQSLCMHEETNTLISLDTDRVLNIWDTRTLRCVRHSLKQN